MTYRGPVDADVQAYVQAVADVVRDVLGPRLVGVYVHGSIVLGGFNRQRSDVDVLVLCGGRMTRPQKAALGAALQDDALPCPAKGLELSVVRRDVARHPSSRPPFEFHVTTAPEDNKCLDGAARTGDPDLVLHFAVCRSSGRLIGCGPRAKEIFAEVPPSLVFNQILRELEWSADEVPNEYAVLNACRAWKFAEDGTLVSKLEGGDWVLSRGVSAKGRILVNAALMLQRNQQASPLDPDEVRRFVFAVLGRLRRARP
jgi:predicted nucleotidyltransferase